MFNVHNVSLCLASMLSPLSFPITHWNELRCRVRNNHRIKLIVLHHMDLPTDDTTLHANVGVSPGFYLCAHKLISHWLNFFSNDRSAEFNWNFSFTSRNANHFAWLRFFLITFEGLLVCMSIYFKCTTMLNEDNIRMLLYDSLAVYDSCIRLQHLLFMRLLLNAHDFIYDFTSVFFFIINR